MSVAHVRQVVMNAPMRIAMHVMDRSEPCRLLSAYPIIRVSGNEGRFFLCQHARLTKFCGSSACTADGVLWFVSMHGLRSFVVRQHARLTKFCDSSAARLETDSTFGDGGCRRRCIRPNCAEQEGSCPCVLSWTVRHHSLRVCSLVSIHIHHRHCVLIRKIHYDPLGGFIRIHQRLCTD